jgi:hypothetical protein
MKKALAIASAVTCLLVGVVATTFSLYQASVNVMSGTVTTRTYQVETVNVTSNTLTTHSLNNSESFNYGFFVTKQTTNYKYNLIVKTWDLPNGVTPTLLLDYVGSSSNVTVTNTNGIYTYLITGVFDYESILTHFVQLKYTNTSGSSLNTSGIKVSITTTGEEEPTEKLYSFYYNATNNAIDGTYKAFNFKNIDWEYSTSSDTTTAYIYDQTGRSYNSNTYQIVFDTREIITNYLNGKGETVYGNVTAAYIKDIKVVATGKTFDAGGNYYLKLALPSKVKTSQYYKILYIDYDTNSKFDYKSFATTDLTSTNWKYSITNADNYYNKVIVNQNISGNNDYVVSGGQWGQKVYGDVTYKSNSSISIDKDIHFTGNATFETDKDFISSNNGGIFDKAVSIYAKGDATLNNETTIKEGLTIESTNTTLTGNTKITGEVNITSTKATNLTSNPVINGDVNITSGTDTNLIGNTHITGNVNIASTANSIIAGTSYINGNVNISGGTNAEISGTASFDGNLIIINSGTISLKNNNSINGNLHLECANDILVSTGPNIDGTVYMNTTSGSITFEGSSKYVSKAAEFYCPNGDFTTNFKFNDTIKVTAKNITFNSNQDIAKLATLYATGNVTLTDKFLTGFDLYSSGSYLSLPTMTYGTSSVNIDSVKAFEVKVNGWISDSTLTINVNKNLLTKESAKYAFKVTQSGMSSQTNIVYDSTIINLDSTNASAFNLKITGLGSSFTNIKLNVV